MPEIFLFAAKKNLRVENPCKYEHLFTKNLHELPIKYEQYSLLKTGMNSQFVHELSNFFTAEDKGVKAMKGFWSFISSSSRK